MPATAGSLERGRGRRLKAPGRLKRRASAGRDRAERERCALEGRRNSVCGYQTVPDAIPRLDRPPFPRLEARSKHLAAKNPPERRVYEMTRLGHGFRNL